MQLKQNTIKRDNNTQDSAQYTARGNTRSDSVFSIWPLDNHTFS